MTQAPSIPDKVGLLQQYLLLLDVVQNRQASGGDKAVAGIIIDRFYKAHGNSRTSISYIQKATGFSRQAVVNSIQRLIDMGYIAIDRVGVGTRASEYVPLFDRIKAAGNRSSQLELTASSGQVELTARYASGQAELTAKGPSGQAELTESYLPEPTYKVGLRVSRNDPHAAPSAPAVSGGVPPSPPGSARDPFSVLWDAYGFRHDRAKAKAAYAKLAPDDDLHTQMVDAAGTWRRAYEAAGTDSKWRKRLHTWLAGEGWLEDAPVAYEDPKRAAIARAKEREPKKRELPAPGKHGHNMPRGETTVQIVAAEPVTSNNGWETVGVALRLASGEAEFEHTFLCVDDDEAVERSGRAVLRSLVHAIGLEQVSDTSEFVGRTVVAIVEPSGAIQYTQSNGEEVILPKAA